MNRPLCAGLALCLTPMLSLGCTSTFETPKPKSEPTPTFSISTTPSVEEPVSELPLSESELADAKAWTDPIMIAALARDCRFKPAPPDRHQALLLSCALEVDQSCVPDLCFTETESQCKPACTKACDGCDDACSTGCESCKKTCNDSNCRKACAAQCGECKQACLRRKDDCATGDCSQAYSTCQKNVVAEWKQGACKSVCAQTVACANKCWSRDDAQACSAACQKRFMGSCPTKFFPYCLFAAYPDGK